MQVSGLGFHVWGLGFQAWGSGFRAWGFGLGAVEHFGSNLGFANGSEGFQTDLNVGTVSLLAKEQFWLAYARRFLDRRRQR